MDNPNTHLMSRSAQEQSLYLLVRPCSKCRSGPLTEISRQQDDGAEGRNDKIQVQCKLCGYQDSLEFFTPAQTGISQESQLIDVGEWLGLCHYFLDLAQSDTDTEKAHEQMVLARYCLNEALKFYPQDSDLPGPDAFFGRLGDSRFKAHPTTFLKSKLLDLRRRITAITPAEHKPGQTAKQRKWWRTK